MEEGGASSAFWALGLLQEVTVYPVPAQGSGLERQVQKLLPPGSLLLQVVGQLPRARPAPPQGKWDTRMSQGTWL